MSTLAELVLIAVGSAIVNNVVLSQFLGICPFLGVSKKTETAAGMGGAVIFVITISSFITGLIYKFILANFFLFCQLFKMCTSDVQNARFQGVFACATEHNTSFKHSFIFLYNVSPSKGEK